MHDASPGDKIGQPGTRGLARAVTVSQAPGASDAKAPGAADGPASIALPVDLQPAAAVPNVAEGLAAGMVSAGVVPPVATTFTAMTAQAGSGTGASASAPPPEVQQIVPAVVSLATATDGTSSLTVSLHPRDLGDVQVQMVRSQDGGTSLTITADRAQTLEQLAQNVHHLHAALDAANIPSEQRTLAFALSPSTDNGSGAAGRGASQGDGGGQNTPQRQASWEDRDGAYRNSAAGSGMAADVTPGMVTRRWVASGLNITA